MGVWPKSWLSPIPRQRMATHQLRGWERGRRRDEGKRIVLLSFSSSTVFRHRVHHLPFFLAAIPRARVAYLLHSISTPFRLYLGDSLVGNYIFNTPEISDRARVSAPEFPREKRTRYLVAGALDAARSIRSSLIQPLLWSRRNSWLIRSHSTERACFRQPVISTRFGYLPTVIPISHAAEFLSKIEREKIALCALRARFLFLIKEFFYNTIIYFIIYQMKIILFNFLKKFI